MMEFQSQEIDSWLTDLRAFVGERDNTVVDLLNLYIEESRFGWYYIAPSLASLPANARVLEVGAGALILSCYVKHCGFQIQALEPLGSGFTHFSRLKNLVLEHAKQFDSMPIVKDHDAENLSEVDVFDFAYSINVMEHIVDLQSAIFRITQSLKKNAIYKFTCPNYNFPYEPHFELPIIFSKRITYFFFEKSIFNNKNHVDSIGLWKSLNWINYQQIRAFSRKLDGISIEFRKNILVDLFKRIEFDPIFAARRSLFSKALARIVLKLRLNTLLVLIPAAVLPVIDCEIKKI